MYPSSLSTLQSKLLLQLFSGTKEGISSIWGTQVSQGPESTLSRAPQGLSQSLRAEWSGSLICTNH